MNYFYSLLLFFFFLSSCRYFEQELDLDKVRNPEKDIYKIYEDFQFESLTKFDVNDDGYLDYTIQGYDQYGDWVEAYFLHNGDKENTYTFVSSDDYYSDDDSDIVERVEDYFLDSELSSTIEELVYQDLDADGLDDAVVVAFYESEEYYSIDAYVFLGLENGYQYNGLAEVHYPMNFVGFKDFRKLVVSDQFFTIELAGENPKWERYITFKYEEDEGAFVLHKDGGKVYDSSGVLVREAVLTTADFGTIYFTDFITDDKVLFSIKQEARVSTVPEFLYALQSNMTIYVNEGVYLLNKLELLPSEAQEKFYASKEWGTFYSEDFYDYYGGEVEEPSNISLILRNLRNVNVIGLGDVQMVVTDEFVTVLSFENCDKIYMENIYFVHDVGGVCGADVVNLYQCKNMVFAESTFDGSGEIGVYANESENLRFENCYFTNCSEGGVEFYTSDAEFESCHFEDNQVWHSLVSANSSSNLYFYQTSFANNVMHEDAKEANIDSYLFKSKDESYIYLDEMCSISNVNSSLEIRNDTEYVYIEEEVIRK